MPNPHLYRWFYDNVHSRYYDLLLKWCFIPFGGENDFRREMLSPIDFTGDSIILDICCGTGGVTSRIRALAGEQAVIVGSDISIGQIKRARRKDGTNDLTLINANATNTPYSSGSFDKVLIPHALHEMVRSVREAVLREAFRVLRPGGETIVLEMDDPDRLYLRVLLGWWLFYWLPFNPETPTRRDMLRCGVDNEMSDAGFIDVRKISKFKGTMQVVIGSKPV
ncbi:MAG: methyltransferase domain-containing protein [bacterium]|nr:methyltransferase domain-containing protein [bacterium]